MKGRKQTHYNAKRKLFYCGDLEAWDICKKKGINISEELTHMLQYLAYKQEDLAVFKQHISALNIAKDKKMNEIETYYNALISQVQKRIGKRRNKQ